MGTATLWVCGDCFITDAYGEPSEDPDYKPDREPWGLWADGGEDITSGLLVHPCGYDHESDDYPVCDGDCERREFSWSRCDGCGSTQGGARYAFTYWYPAENVG